MENGALYVVILVVCVLVSAFFSAAETALTSLSESKTRQLIDEGGRPARALQLWLHHPNRVLTTLLVGNNVANTLTAAIATVLTQSYFDHYAISIATGATTLVLLVFGEVTPKTFAKHNARWFAPAAMSLLVPVYWLIYPLVYLLSWIASATLRLFGGKSSHSGPTATEEDITFMIRLGHQEGVIAREEGEMLESVIEFRDTVVREAMVPRSAMCALELDSSYDDVISEVRKQGHSRWPVFDDHIDNMRGIVHIKDLMGISDEEQANFSLVKYLRPALIVPDMMKIGTILKEFRHGKGHLAIVVDEYGSTAGVISLEDVLEEIVGEIRDEYDSEEDERLIRKLDERRYLVDGHASLSKIEEEFGVDFPDEDYESLGGFLIATYGKMPHVGAQIVFKGFRFVIKEADPKRIIRVLVEKLDQV